MLNIKKVVNRSLSGALNGGSIGSALGGGIGGFVGSTIGAIIGGGKAGGFSGMQSGNANAAGGLPVTLGFKKGHPYAGYPGLLAPLAKSNGMAWPYRPNIDISRSINYETTSPTHGMQDFKSFRNNSSAYITVSGYFSAQNIEEANYMQASIHFLRTASLMSFGKGGSVPAGMPPPVLNFQAYGQQNMNNVPVVLDNIITSYPSDIDYINVNGNEIPTLMNITCTLSVMLSPEQLRNFSLDAYASGNLQGYI